jgi:hypothetical protein
MPRTPGAAVAGAVALAWTAAGWPGGTGAVSSRRPVPLSLRKERAVGDNQAAVPAAQGLDQRRDAFPLHDHGGGPVPVVRGETRVDDGVEPRSQFAGLRWRSGRCATPSFGGPSRR